jgi:hypothetical protein
MSFGMPEGGGLHYYQHYQPAAADAPQSGVLLAAEALQGAIYIPKLNASMRRFGRGFPRYTTWLSSCIEKSLQPKMAPDILFKGAAR